MGTITKCKIHGYRIYKLKVDSSTWGNIEAWVNADHGMNLCQLMVGGHKIIAWDIERCENKASYGTPILYPSPNRVENNAFTYGGDVYPMTMHGVMRFQPCLPHELYKEDSIGLCGEYLFEEGTDLYETFPFKSNVELFIELTDNKLKIKYRITNLDSKVLPFGFAIHPFFRKIGHTLIRSRAKRVMEMSDVKLPSGNCLEVDKTLFDLTSWSDVQCLNLDHVYTDIDKESDAEIWYEDLGLHMDLQATKAFTHLVIFTPKGEDFFCIENQTCSTNAHNLYNEGFYRESGLELVAPGQCKSGEVSILFNKIDENYDFRRYKK